MSNYEEVFEYIDTNFDQHIRVVQDHLRQPSVSLVNEGVLECARMLASSIRELGGENVQLVPLTRLPCGFWQNHVKESKR